VINYRRFLEEQIQIQREAISRWQRWFLVLVIGGLAILILGLFVGKAGLAGAETMKLAGAFVGVIAVFPYREIIPRRERIVTYTLLLSGVHSYKTLSADEQQRLLAYLGDAVKETLKR
jgi:type II secretory pathway component PulL